MASSTAVRATRRVVPLILAGWLAACAGEPQARKPRSISRRPCRTRSAPSARRFTCSIRSPRPSSKATASWCAPARRRPCWRGPDGPLRLPVLLQSRLAESLQNAQDLKVDDGRTAADYNLETEVRAFELDADQKQVVVEFVVKLVSARDNHIKAFKTFKTRAPVVSTDPHEVTTALNGALSSVMAQIVAFVAASV